MGDTGRRRRRLAVAPPPVTVAVAVAVALTLVAGLATTVAAAPPPPPPPTPVRDVHDPMIVAEGDWWYLYSTGTGIPARRSADLVTWEGLPPVFPATPPPWWDAIRSGAGDAWAPHVVAVPGGFRIYYAVSTFGSQHSAIGMAHTATLDPGAPGYGWVDDGVVVTTDVGDDLNAIDPAVATEADGTSWLLWGSFWDGIVAQALDPATGSLLDPSAPPVALARRAPWPAVEASFAAFHDGWWYLFTSFDVCCRPDATYHVRVGRSRSLLGPYVDADGVPLLDGGGSVVIAGHGDAVRGPGHEAVLAVGDELLLAYHWYDATAGGARTLALSALAWVDGWPVAAPPGVDATAAPRTPDSMVGTWRVDHHHRTNPYTRDLGLLADGRVAGGGRWSLAGATLRIEVSVGGCDGTTRPAVYTAVVDGSLVGRDEFGWSAWATRTGPPPPDPCPGPADRAGPGDTGSGAGGGSSTTGDPAATGPDGLPSSPTAVPVVASPRITG